MVRKYRFFIILAIACLLIFTVSCNFKKKDASNEEKAVEINGSKVVLEVGDQYDCDATYKEFGVEKTDDLSWTINDNSICTVANGKITALAMGEAIVKVFLASDESINATIYVSVKKASTFEYDLAGGTCDVNIKSLYAKGAENVLPIPTKTGYQFAGWYLNGKKVTTLTYQPGREVKLVAEWNINKYQIKFSDGVATQRYEYGQTTVAPTDPVKTGYDFLGWFDGENEYVFGNAIDADADLVAKWEIKHFVVTFDLPEVADQNLDYGQKAVEPAEPAKTGYNFLGWFNGTALYDFAAEVTENIDLVAKYEIKKYTVTFDVGGIDDQVVEHFAKVAKPADPTRTEYDFKGWMNGSVAYDFEAEVTGPLNLTAKWEIKHFTVTFDVEGITDQVVDYGNTATVPTPAPEKTGYNFIGWLNGTAEYNFTTPVTSDLNLTAKFEIKKYTVTFDVAGIDDQIIEHFAKVAKPVDPTRTEYDFKGWMNGETPYDFDAQVTGPLNLTAKWEIKHFTVTFDIDGIDDQVVDYGNLATAPTPAPEKTGYTFMGWSAGVGIYDFATPVTSNIDLTAVFEINKYTVTFTDGYASQTDIEYGQKAVKPATDPTKEGYVFVGWFDGATEFDFNTEIHSDYNLVSKWALIINCDSTDTYNLTHFNVTIIVNAAFDGTEEYYSVAGEIYHFGTDKIYATTDAADAISVNGDIIYNFNTKSILQVLKAE